MTKVVHFVFLTVKHAEMIELVKLVKYKIIYYKMAYIQRVIKMQYTFNKFSKVFNYKNILNVLCQKILGRMLTI